MTHWWECPSNLLFTFVPNWEGGGNKQQDFVMKWTRAESCKWAKTKFFIVEEIIDDVYFLDDLILCQQWEWFRQWSWWKLCEKYEFRWISLIVEKEAYYSYSLKFLLWFRPFFTPAIITLVLFMRQSIFPAQEMMRRIKIDTVAQVREG